MKRNFMFWNVFRDCNFSCDFCEFKITLSGDIGCSKAFARFKDLDFHKAMLRLYDEQLSRVGSWSICLTGGEPLLMPHLPFLSRELIRRGHRMLYNTNLSVPIEKNEDFLASNPPEAVDVFMVSIHPESHRHLDKILERIRLLKGMGYRLIVRTVATLEAFSTMRMLDDVCREMDVTFTPLGFRPFRDNTNLLEYTQEQFIFLRSFMKGYGELISLYGGLDTREVTCHARYRSLVLSTTSEDMIIAVGTCINCMAQRLAVFDLSLPTAGEGLYDHIAREPQPCPCPTTACRCPSHFEYGLVVGLEEAEDQYEKMCKGVTEPVWEKFESWVLRTGLRLHSSPRCLKDVPTQLHSILPFKRRFGFLNKFLKPLSRNS